MNALFLDKQWMPLNCNMNVTKMNAFVHAINLATCGPLFPDVQAFLRLYAISKRMTLINTQDMFLDSALRFGPINRIVYDFAHE